MNITKNEVHDFLIDEIYTLTKAKDIDSNTTLDNYGFESITYTELVNSINDTFNTDFLPTMIFELDSPTLNNIINYIIAEQETIKSDEKNFDEDIKNNENILKIKKDNIYKKNDSKEVNRTTLEMEDNDKEYDINKADIAIIGIDGKFPQSDSLEDFWENIANHRNLITKIPIERFDYKKYSNPHIKWGGFMNNIDKFDAKFFNMSDKEAKFLDPQHRLFLQSTMKTIGDAGYTLKDIDGMRLGVFAGIGSQDYAELIKDNIDVTDPPPYALTGITSFMLANRVSSFLNVKGPSEPIDTACSSSLVAINRAINAMLSKECDMALVGGVNVITTPAIYHSFSSAGMLNKSSTCKVFDDNASGTIRAEGVGTILLKPVAKAISDRDNIHAVIKSSTVNHKGKTSSLTAINKSSIVDLLDQSYSELDIGIEDIDYIESHSTGSKIGDSIELQALQTYMKKSYSKKNLFVGSLKSNLGHMEAASGIGSLIKVILSIKNKMLLGINNFEKLNSYVKNEENLITLTKSNKPWERRDYNTPRRAAINTFGFGGVNAHLIIEEYINENIEIDTKKNIFVLSDKSEKSLKEKVVDYINHFENKEFTDADITNICYTLQNGRESLAHRLAFVVESIQDILTNLKSYLKGEYNEAIINVSNLEYQNNKYISEILDTTEIKDVLISWLKQGELNKIQKLWINGLTVPWKYLYLEKNPHKISLPSYNFEENSYWVNQRLPPFQLKRNLNYTINQTAKEYTQDINIENEIYNLIIDFLPNADSFNELSSFKEYGVDSIIFIQIIKKLQSLGIPINFEDIYNSYNLKELVENLNISQGSINKNDHISLIKLNEITDGKPIFWIHGGFGGVEVYRFIAEHINRPFYGIQAPGYMTDQEPLNTVEDLANYYYKIIKDIQVDGGYDIGGLSFGGVIAYELANVLQKENHKVHSLVMLESIFIKDSMREEWESININNIRKDRIFRIANLLLSFNNSTDTKLIHERDVSLYDNFDDFFENIINLMIEKGIYKNKKQLKKLLNNLYKVLTRLDEASTFYAPSKLTNDIEKPIYISNEYTTVFGNEEDYFRLVDKGRVFDFTESYKLWKGLIPNLEIQYTVSSSHLTILTDKHSLEKIINICKEIYYDE
ncbi:beta-ketoacyl synthase N-terminal-like domain-containing protein [Staphylococcus cohnii]